MAALRAGWCCAARRVAC
ncbi:hypothetical protein A2U01_0090003, partial [Trifolium medium]|nr:hypothetical protein [Trifolium medium]